MIVICGVGIWIVYWCKFRVVLVFIKFEFCLVLDDEGVVRSLEGFFRGNELGRENVV